MAGEKLSSRQKMIGMMYLVLTALLALQVSGSVLEKFILINKSLEKSVYTQRVENKRTLKRIEQTVKESGNRAKDVTVLQKANQLAQESDRVVAYIESLKRKLIKITGGTNKKTGVPKGIKNDSAVANLMVNHSKGIDLQKLLNGYMQYLTGVTGKQYVPIALDAKDSKIFKEDPNQSNKDFATLNFDHTPLGAALATLSQFESEVVYAEADALGLLFREVGAGDAKFDRLVPIVKPQSNTVAAGSKYKAQLFLAASSSGISPTMAVNGRQIAVSEGVGTVEFTAPTGKYNSEGVAKRKFKAEWR
ncbi:MAG: gliding motility protein GldM, partial [Bacteroidota bacterium]